MGNLQAAVDKAMTRKDAYILTKGNNRGMIGFTSGKDWVAVSQMEDFGLNKAEQVLDTLIPEASQLLP